VNAIAECLWPQDVLLDVDVADKNDLFQAIGRHMQREHELAPNWVSLSLSRREQAASTGLGEGVAIPHARVEGLSRVHALYARLKSPIPFDAPDGSPVSHVLVLLVPYPAAEEHLALLAAASQLFSDRRFRNRLEQCTHVHDVLRLFSDWPGLPAAT